MHDLYCQYRILRFRESGDVYIAVCEGICRGTVGSSQASLSTMQERRVEMEVYLDGVVPIGAKPPEQLFTYKELLDFLHETYPAPTPRANPFSDI